MNCLEKTASAVVLAVGLAAPFSAAEAGGEYYPNGAYRARHGHHDHHGHHGGRDGSYRAGVVTGAVAGVLLGVPQRPYYAPRPAPVFVAPPVYREPVYVVASPVVHRQPVYVDPRPPAQLTVCDEFGRCAPAYREVIIEGMQCQANDFAATCLDRSGRRFNFALD